MYYAQPRRVQPRGLRLRKDTRPGQIDLPDSHYPSARIARIRATRPPGWLSNREGWRRFYRRQIWFGHLLDLIHNKEKS